MIAILISTFDRYKILAEWTAAQIKRQWLQHPPLFYSGLVGENEQFLGCPNSPTDWMSVTLHAVEKLQQRGFTHAYLILDDHPPVGPCHEEALNEVIPSLAQKFKASYVGLLGYGQGRGVDGKVLEHQYSLLEQSSIFYRWKFSLHPGLWNLKALHAILLQRQDFYSKEECTAWKFEKHCDDVNNLKIVSLMQRSYRINGTVFLKKKWLMRKDVLCERAERLVVDVMLFASKITGASLARDLTERKHFWRYGHYLGPYPLFWSGVMQQGKPHQDWERWLQRSGDLGLQSSWNELKRQVFTCNL